MKLIALATALALTGTAAIAQDTATPPPPPPPAADAPPPADTPAPPAGQMTTPPPAAGAAPMAQSTPVDTASPGAQQTPGGYQPAMPPMSGPATPGQQVIFQPSKSPTEAYPPPAPMQSYPICKQGQYDKCRQRGG